MRRLTRYIFVQCLVICALVTAGISPACAFIAGKASLPGMSLIEICGPEGLMTVSVPADSSPGDAGGPADHQSHQKNAAHDCGFCLVQASGKAITTPDTAIIDFTFVYDAPALAPAHSFVSFTLDGRLPARGPPVLLT
ncbi:MAG TPA: DUF2946 domain-containing protein [Micavibrio sp.]